MEMIYQLKYKITVLCLLLIVTVAGAQDQNKKYVKKNFEVNAETELKIINKFGKVEINSWEKNEFKVKVEIISKSRNEKRMQKNLDAIEIGVTKSSSAIVFETKYTQRAKDEFEVHYTVYMPEGNPLDITNKFGDVVMGDRNNDLKINVSYGSMRVGEVSGDAAITLSFGSGSIESIRDGEVTIKYSDFEIYHAGKLDLTQGFSTIEIGEVTDLEFTSKYGEVEIEKADRIDSEVHFTDFDIGELTGSIKLVCSYLGGFQINKLAKTFTLVDIDGKFGSYEIGMVEGINADIYGEFSYADLEYSSNLDVTFSHRVEEINSSTYKGKIGKGDPNKTIRIVSRYGDLELTRD